MKLLVLNQSAIEHLLPMHDCITVMADALMALAKGQVHLPLRMEVADHVKLFICSKDQKKGLWGSTRRTEPNRLSSRDHSAPSCLGNRK